MSATAAARRPGNARSRRASRRSRTRGLAVPGQVGGRFACAGRGVEIGGEAAGRLRPGQQPAGLRLADGDVAGREVGQDGGAGQGALGRWAASAPRRPRRSRRGSSGGKSSAVEQQVGAERGPGRPMRDLRRCRRRRRNAAARRTRDSWAGGSLAPRRAGGRGGSPGRSCRVGAVAQRRADHQRQQVRGALDQGDSAARWRSARVRHSRSSIA